MPCEKCGKMTPFNGLIRAGRVPCVHCGATRPHTPLRTGCWHLIMLIFFAGTIPVALIWGEGAIGVIFPLFLLLFMGDGCGVYRRMSDLQVEGESSILFAVLFNRHPRGRWSPPCSALPGLWIKRVDIPGDGGSGRRAHPLRSPFPVPASNPGPIGRSSRGGGKGRPGEKLSRGIEAGQGAGRIRLPRARGLRAG